MSEASRLQQLEAMYEQDPQDTFIRYGLALEYYAADRRAEGEQRLRALIADQPDHVAACFQLAKKLAEEQRVDEAKEALQTGLAAAQRAGDQHAEAEMTDYLNMLH